jgi:redox-sensitive bicupin YhaK (pirin superfamily)
LPAAAGPETARVLYVFEGGFVRIADVDVAAPTAAGVDAREPIMLLAGAEPVEILVLQARPIGEPVAQYGPFVMNDDAGIRQAFADYRDTQFGGWPWDDDAPTHGAGQGRFARHADGRVDEVVPAR